MPKIRHISYSDLLSEIEDSRAVEEELSREQNFALNSILAEIGGVAMNFSAAMTDENFEIFEGVI